MLADVVGLLSAGGERHAQVAAAFLLLGLVLGALAAAQAALLFLWWWPTQLQRPKHAAVDVAPKASGSGELVVLSAGDGSAGVAATPAQAQGVASSSGAVASSSFDGFPGPEPAATAGSDVIAVQPEAYPSSPFDATAAPAQHPSSYLAAAPASPLRPLAPSSDPHELVRLNVSGERFTLRRAVLTQQVPLVIAADELAAGGGKFAPTPRTSRSGVHQHPHQPKHQYQRHSSSQFVVMAPTMLSAMFSARWSSGLSMDQDGATFLELDPVCFRRVAHGFLLRGHHPMGGTAPAPHASHAAHARIGNVLQRIISAPCFHMGRNLRAGRQPSHHPRCRALLASSPPLPGASPTG